MFKSITLVNGIKNGPEKFYFKMENWTKFEILRRERDGPWIRYYENGNIFRKGNYKDGRQHGLWEWYWENGK